MADILRPFKKVIHDTTTEVIDTQLPDKVADVFKTFVTSVFEVVDDTLVAIQDLTKEGTQEEKPEETEDP